MQKRNICANSQKVVVKTIESKLENLKCKYQLKLHRTPFWTCNLNKNILTPMIIYKL